jgi:hypothetical protein
MTASYSRLITRVKAIPIVLILIILGSSVFSGISSEAKSRRASINEVCLNAFDGNIHVASLRPNSISKEVKDSGSRQLVFGACYIIFNKNFDYLKHLLSRPVSGTIFSKDHFWLFLFLRVIRI